MRRMIFGALLAVWSAGFACVHVAWALGWRGGVPADQPPISDRPVFLTYDLTAALLMYAAALVALVLATGPARPRLMARLVLATRVGAALALLRGAPALLIDAVTRDVTAVGLCSDLWFTVAGVAGLVLARLSGAPLSRAASPRGTRAPGRRPPADGAR